MTFEQQLTHAFEESRDDVCRHLLNLRLSPPRTQEATQEVFLRVYRRACPVNSA